MNTVLAVILCHMVNVGEPPACHVEEIAVGVPMMVCLNSQAIVAEWKRYHFDDDAYTVKRIMCTPGNANPLDPMND